MTEHITVPVEPTKEMVDAAWDKTGIAFAGPQHFEIAYKAMCAAAPKPDDELARTGATPAERCAYARGWSDGLENRGWTGREADEQIELARLEREIAESVLREAFDLIPAAGCRWPDGDDEIWFAPTEYVDAGLLEWGHGRGLLERHPEHPEWVRVKEQSDE